MSRKRILIVEDDPLTAMDLETIVSTIVDAEILFSRSVARARKLIEDSVDLALLDIDVTNGKTFEVASLLKRLKVPFVFLTGSRREEIPQEFSDAPFIAKPYDPRQVAKQIRLVISD